MSTRSTIDNKPRAGSTVHDQVRRLPRSLAYLYLGTIATRLGSFVVPYLTLYLSEHRGMSPSTTGQIVAVGGFGLLVGNLLGGWSADRVGRKPTLLAALGINVVGVAALACTLPSETAYAVALALALAGAGMYTPAANALIADCTSHAQRPFAYAVHYVCISVGMGLGPLLGGLLAASAFTWLFVGDIATTLVCMALVAVGVRAPARIARQDSTLGSTLRVWARHPRILVFCGASFFVVAPLMGLEYAVPLLVGRLLQEPLAYIGLVYSINAGCILLLGLPIERALRGRDERTMMAVAGGLWTAGLLILLVGCSTTALLVSTVVWTQGEIIASVVVPTYVSRRVEASAKGRLLALQDVVRSSAGIVAPLALGMVWDWSGPGAVLMVLVVTPAVGTLLYLTSGWVGMGRAAAPNERAALGST